MIKIGNPNSLCIAWMGFYLPPFLLAYEIIYHLASGTPFWVAPILPAIPVAITASLQFVLILGGQGLIFEYVLSLKARICFSVLLCFIVTFTTVYWIEFYDTDPETTIKGLSNSALWSSIIALPITIFFLCFVHGRSEKSLDK